MPRVPYSKDEGLNEAEKAPSKNFRKLWEPMPGLI